jgi:hypothetical protein
VLLEALSVAKQWNSTKLEQRAKVIDLVRYRRACQTPMMGSVDRCDGFKQLCAARSNGVGYWSHQYWHTRGFPTS